jgi:glycosyltransferase involved in cell wall biosynthesis
MPKVSVVMPVYNGEKTLRNSIESILNLSYKNFELIIINDGSTDSSEEIIKSFNDERIKYFKKENSGAQAAPRNLGISKATGDFIAFCDQDDIWYSEKLDKQIKVYEISEERGGIGIIFCSANLIDEGDKKIGENSVLFEGFLSAKESFNRLIMGNFITACSAIFPRHVFDEVGRLDENLKGVDDYDLWLRIAFKYGIIGINEPLCGWRQSTNSFSVDKSKQYVEVEKIFDKLGDKTEEIKVGHGKNMIRIITASLLAKKYDIVSEYSKKIHNYSVSFKARIIIWISRLSHKFGRFFVIILQKLGMVSL